MIAIRGTDVGRMQEQGDKKTGVWGQVWRYRSKAQQEELCQYLTLFVAKTIVEGMCFDTVLPRLKVRAVYSWIADPQDAHE